MPYIVREGDPLPWFQGTSDALGSLIDVAMRDRQSNQAAARDEAAFGRQRQAAGEDYTRNRAAAKEDYTTRQADENTRDLRNFGQQRDLIGMRQQYETEQANRARTEDADAATTLAPMLNLPVEAPMAGGAAGPGPMANYGKMGTKGVLAIAQNQRALADDQRQGVALEQRAGTAAELADYRNRSLGLREQGMQGTQDYRNQMLGLSADRLAEMKRGAAERKAARDAAVKRLAPDQQIKVQQWDRELDYLYKLRDDEELRNTEGWTAQQVLDEIANAEAQQRAIVGSATQQPVQPSPASYDGLSDDELDARLLGG